MKEVAYSGFQRGDFNLKNELKEGGSKKFVAQSAGVVEYTDCISAKG